ncbi:MscL family protein [Candidatus Saccharibacteria bacterium]|nr:MscL family protein [Candidatus Saccharibacteria bacterium]
MEKEIKTVRIIKKAEPGPSSFIKFLRDQSVLGVAMGMVIGVAGSAFINSLINNIVMPPIALLLGAANGLKSMVWVITTDSGNTATISYGQFINDLINFLVIAFVVYIVIRIFKVQAKR